MKTIKKTTAILFYDNERRILLKQRTFDAPKHPGLWSVFGGHNEEDETPKGCVIRETKEELGVDIENPQLLFTSEYNYKEYIDKMAVFIHKYNINMHMVQKEGRAKEWFTIEEALQLDMSPDVKVAIEKIKEMGPTIFDS